MEDRQPTIDPQTFEVIHDVFKIVAAADNGDGKIEHNDLAYIHGKLEDVLKFNSLPLEDPRGDPKFADQIKKLGRFGRKLLP